MTKLKKPYNSIHTNPQLDKLLIPDRVTINTQPNSINGNFPEYTAEGIRVFVNGKYELIKEE